MKLVSKFWMKNGAVLESEYVFLDGTTIEEARSWHAKMTECWRNACDTGIDGHLTVGLLTVRIPDVSAALMFVDETTAKPSPGEEELKNVSKK